VRAEIARVVPLYDGIQHLRSKGDAFQYGGPQLCPGGVCPTPSGRARFLPVVLPESSLPAGAYRLVTRRGKQFNSMVLEHTDPINGAPRDAVLMNPSDLQKLGLQPGQQVWLQNPSGTLAGRVFAAKLRPGSIQVHWPEGNVLVDPALRSSQAKIPAYKEVYVYIHTQPPS